MLIVVSAYEERRVLAHILFVLGIHARKVKTSSHAASEVLNSIPCVPAASAELCCAIFFPEHCTSAATLQRVLVLPDCNSAAAAAAADGPTRLHTAGFYLSIWTRSCCARLTGIDSQGEEPTSINSSEAHLYLYWSTKAAGPPQERGDSPVPG